MAKPKVLVSRRWPEAVEARLNDQFDVTLNRDDKPLQPEDFRAAMREYDAILPTVTDKLGSAALETERAQTRILANYGVGYSHIDLAAASGHGIVVTNTPDVLSECTADLAMTLMLMSARRAGEGEREVRANEWSGWRPTHLIGTKVSGKTLGIIGYGRIGQAMAKRAHHGFGMKILAYDYAQLSPEVLAPNNAMQVASVDELLPQCDFVSLHCPGGAANKHLINANRLALMRPDAHLINTARGEVVDEAALAKALWFETIGGAALDVYEEEPSINPALKDSDRLVLLPHLGSATRETRDAMGFRVIDNLEDFFAGREPRDRVN